MSNKSKAKGTYFENIVAEKIRKKLNLSKKEVHRNSESGSASYSFSDIYTPFDLLIECKFWNTIPYKKLLTEWSSFINPIKTQIDKEVEKYIKIVNRIPLIIIVTSAPRSTILTTFFIDNLESNDFLKLDYNQFEYFCIDKVNNLVVVDFEFFLNLLVKTKEK
jgi:hypothetical protein